MLTMTLSSPLVHLFILTIGLVILETLVVSCDNPDVTFALHCRVAGSLKDQRDGDDCRHNLELERTPKVQQKQ